MKIYVRNNDITKALKVLKKKMLEEGDIKEFRSKQHFISNGEQKRLDEKAGRRRWLKKRVKIEQNRVKAEQMAFSKNKRKKQYNNQSKKPVA